MNWPTVDGTVLVPFDFSDASREALDVAAKFCRSPAQLHVVHVVAPLPPMAPGVVWSTFDEGDAAEHARKSLRETLQSSGLEAAAAEVRIGDPGQAIVDIASDRSADLIVIPTHGRTGIRRFLMGSVATRVVQHAPCAVLVLRNKDLVPSA